MGTEWRFFILSSAGLFVVLLASPSYWEVWQGPKLCVVFAGDRMHWVGLKKENIFHGHESLSRSVREMAFSPNLTLAVQLTVAWVIQATLGTGRGLEEGQFWESRGRKGRAEAPRGRGTQGSFSIVCCRLCLGASLTRPSGFPVGEGCLTCHSTMPAAPHSHLPWILSCSSHRLFSWTLCSLVFSCCPLCCPFLSLNLEFLFHISHA